MTLSIVIKVREWRLDHGKKWPENYAWGDWFIWNSIYQYHLIRHLFKVIVQSRPKSSTHGQVGSCVLEPPLPQVIIKYLLSIHSAIKQVWIPIFSPRRQGTHKHLDGMWKINLNKVFLKEINDLQSFFWMYLWGTSHGFLLCHGSILGNVSSAFTRTPIFCSLWYLLLRIKKQELICGMLHNSSWVSSTNSNLNCDYP